MKIFSMLAVSLSLAFATVACTADQQGPIVVTAHDIQTLAAGTTLQVSLDEGRNVRFDTSAGPIEFARVDVTSAGATNGVETILDAMDPVQAQQFEANGFELDAPALDASTSERPVSCISHWVFEVVQPDGSVLQVGVSCHCGTTECWVSGTNQ